MVPCFPVWSWTFPFEDQTTVHWAMAITVVFTGIESARLRPSGWIQKTPLFAYPSLKLMMPPALKLMGFIPPKPLVAVMLGVSAEHTFSPILTMPRGLPKFNLVVYASIITLKGKTCFVSEPETDDQLTSAVWVFGGPPFWGPRSPLSGITWPGPGDPLHPGRSRTFDAGGPLCPAPRVFCFWCVGGGVSSLHVLLSN